MSQNTTTHAYVVVDDTNFDDVVLKATLPVIVDFWATWCPPCKLIGPMVEKLAVEFAGRLLVVKVDVDKAPKNKAKYGVNSIPQLFYFNAGEIAQVIKGSKPYADLKADFEAFAKTSSSAAAIAVDPVAESAYIAAAATAQEKLEQALEPARANLTAAATPFKKSFDRKVKYRGKKLANGKFGQTEHDTQIAGLKAALGDVMAPFREAFSAIANPAWDAYRADMDAANQAFTSALVTSND
jgi:thioredoxin 1